MSMEIERLTECIGRAVQHAQFRTVYGNRFDSPADARVTLARLPAAMKLVAPRRSLWQESILQFPSHCVPFAGG